MFGFVHVVRLSFARMAFFVMANLVFLYLNPLILMPCSCRKLDPKRQQGWIKKLLAPEKEAQQIMNAGRCGSYVSNF